MLDQIEQHFAGAGRTPKGRRALGAIFRATREVILGSGVADASLDAIAGRAGLSQAALRHYFPTRDDLLASFFVSATAWYREQARSLLAAGIHGPRASLRTYVDWHLQYMEKVDTALWFESSAYWLRRPAVRRQRDDFYAWLLLQYATLIGEARPELRAGDRRQRAYALLTLVLGAWVTHGKGSAVTQGLPAARRRQQLLDSALAVALG